MIMLTCVQFSNINLGRVSGVAEHLAGAEAGSGQPPAEGRARLLQTVPGQNRVY